MSIAGKREDAEDDLAVRQVNRLSHVRGDSPQDSNDDVGLQFTNTFRQ